MISEYYIIFLAGFAYYMLFRCIRAEVIGEAILAGFSAVIASIVGIIGNWQVGTVIPSTSFVLQNGTLINGTTTPITVPMYFDAFAFVFYPVLVLGIITAVIKTLELIEINKDN